MSARLPGEATGVEEQPALASRTGATTAIRESSRGMAGTVRAAWWPLGWSGAGVRSAKGVREAMQTLRSGR